jgi:hypothetical protein
MTSIDGSLQVSGEILRLGSEDREGWRGNEGAAKEKCGTIDLQCIYRARGDLIVNKDVEHAGVVSTVRKRGRGRR